MKCELDINADSQEPNEVIKVCNFIIIFRASQSVSMTMK